MIVVNAKEVKPDDRPLVTLKRLFSGNELDGGKTVFGTVTVPPKARIPLTATAAHEEDEYSIIVKGSIITGIGDTEYRLSAGDATLIPAGETHWSYNDGEEDCEIVWVLVKR